MNDQCLGKSIPVIVGQRPWTGRPRVQYKQRISEPKRANLINISCCDKRTKVTNKINDTTSRSIPGMYVFNSCSLAKPHALKQMQAELISYGVDVGMISETHFKEKHTEEIIQIEGYNIIRRDRKKRRGGGVALILHQDWQHRIL